MSVSVHVPVTYDLSKSNRGSLTSQSTPSSPLSSRTKSNKRLSVCLTPLIPDRSNSLIFLPDAFQGLSFSDAELSMRSPMSMSKPPSARLDLLPLCEIPEELDSDSSPTSQDPPTWKDQASELKRIMMTMLDQSRMLAEQLVEAERRSKVFQAHNNELQQRLSTVTKECEIANRELQATRRMLRESEHVRSHWSLRSASKDDGSTGSTPTSATVASRDSIKTVEPEPSSAPAIPISFIRKKKKHHSVRE